jgi:arginase
MKRSIAIVECPTNLGLKEPKSGHEPGVKKLPDFLRHFGFHSLLQAAQIARLDPAPYSMQLDKVSGVRNADAINAYAQQQAILLEQMLVNNHFPIVIGGDCSILIGNALALKQRGHYGLFFLDGHTDFMWPSLSQTGGAAGMDLAIVTGHGHQKLINIHQQQPYFREEDVYCVGNREYTDWYVDVINKSNIHYFSLDALREKGIVQLVEAFLKMVTEKNLDGFWIHIDVDVLNDAIMPAVDSRQDNGLSYEEFNQIIGLLVAHENACGLNISILDPELDKEGVYTKEFVRNFCGVINQIGSS